MAKFRAPSKAVLAGRARRTGVRTKRLARIEWFIKNVSDKTAFSMKARVKLTTDLLKNKVVDNISKPVTKGKGPRGGTVVTNRSKPGEFPKADTTHLMKTIFGKVIQSRKGSYDGFIGTTLDYGVILELRMKRSFLVRTMNEERPTVMRILTGPIKG